MKTLITLLAIISSISIFKAEGNLIELQMIGISNGLLSTTFTELPFTESEQLITFNSNVMHQKEVVQFINSFINTLFLEIFKIIVFTLILSFGISGISLFIIQKDSLEIF